MFPLKLQLAAILFLKYISLFPTIFTFQVLSNIIFIGAELGGAAGARAPPVLHNPRKFIV